MFALASKNFLNSNLNSLPKIPWNYFHQYYSDIQWKIHVAKRKRILEKRKVLNLFVLILIKQYFCICVSWKVIFKYWMGGDIKFWKSILDKIVKYILRDVNWTLFKNELRLTFRLDAQEHLICILHFLGWWCQVQVWCECENLKTFLFRLFLSCWMVI